MLYFVEIISLSASGCLTSDNQKKKKFTPHLPSVLYTRLSLYAEIPGWKMVTKKNHGAWSMLCWTLTQLSLACYYTSLSKRVIARMGGGHRQQKERNGYRILLLEFQLSRKVCSCFSFRGYWLENTAQIFQIVGGTPRILWRSFIYMHVYITPHLHGLRKSIFVSYGRKFLTHGVNASRK